MASRRGGGMLEISETNAADKNTEESKRKKAKLLKKLKEQEGLVNANKQVMVRDRRRPRKSIKEMSVLNKRRRVIKNTARKEIAQQRATLESMRHIELKRYSLEARELELFVERVRKVKENKRLTMLFSKFQVSHDGEEGEESGGEQDKSAAAQTDQQSESASVSADKSRQTRGGDKGDSSESMTNLIQELNNMNQLIDLDKNPQWKYIMGGQDKDRPTSTATTEASEQEAPSGPVRFGGSPLQRQSTPSAAARYRAQALEAPAELQSIQRFPAISNEKATSKDDSDIDSYSGVRRCLSQPTINSSSLTKSTKRLSMSSGPTLTNNVEKKAPQQKRTEQQKSNKDVEALSYHTNWREREKRGQALYSPVALSPIQSGLASPDFTIDEDELTANYRRQLNPKRYQVGGLASGDMEFKQAMDKMPTESGPKKVGYQGTQSIIEMQLNTKTKNISDKVAKVRKETMGPNRSSAKSIAQQIHQSGEGSRFIEEMRMLRSFASLCNCKYLRTDPEKLEERRQAYIDDLVNNVSRRVQIRKKWRLSMKIKKMGSAPTMTLPLIPQGAAE